MELIAIHLVEKLCERIDNPGQIVDEQPYVAHVPIGWYPTEYSVGVTEEGKERIERIREFVMVFEHSKARYERFVDKVFHELPQEWGKETLEQDWMTQQVKQWRDAYFEADNDVGNGLERNLISIARHIGANGYRPEFVPFEERDKYDLDDLAKRFYEQPVPAQLHNLRTEFDRDGNLWRVFYKGSFEWFKMDFDAAIYRLWRLQTEGETSSRPSQPGHKRTITNQDEWLRLREQVFERDRYTCQACGASGKGIKLHVDHIVSRDHGGEDTISNLQTLCSVCNGKYKGVNDLNFRTHMTPLKSPKTPAFLSANAGEDPERSLRRLVNFFYHCGAVCKVKMSSRRNGKNYSCWEVNLFAANDPSWLAEHKHHLLRHIADNFGCVHVSDIIIS